MSVLFFFYAVLLPHRHPLSHLPIVGTFLRVFYLFLVGAEFAIWFGYWPEYARWWRYSAAEPPLSWFWVGLGIVDLLHWLGDGTPMPKALIKKFGTWKES